MRHSFLDKYSHKNGLLQKTDPLSKILFTVIYYLYILIFAQKWLWSYLIAFILIMILIFISKIPILFLLKRLLSIIPFILLIILFIPFYKENGYKTLYLTIIKSILSIVLLIIILSTTRFSDLLKGLSKLKVPITIITILSFIYRYIFVLVDIMEKMLRAITLRSFKKKRIKDIRTIAHILGVLFIRSYERSERVYSAMLLRGFDGEFKR